MSGLGPFLSLPLHVNHLQSRDTEHIVSPFQQLRSDRHTLVVHVQASTFASDPVAEQVQSFLSRLIMSCFALSFKDEKYSWSYSPDHFNHQPASNYQLGFVIDKSCL